MFLIKQVNFSRQYFLLPVLLLLFSCKKENEQNCESIIISYSTSSSDSCVEKGTILITSPTGSGYRYKTGNTMYAASTLVSGLQPGTHTLFVKDPQGCEDSVSIIIPATVAGPLFTATKNVLASYCFPCHTGSNPQAGNDWGENCDILTKWERIQERAVNGNPAPMPPSGLIPPAERDKIRHWINAGHRINN